MDIRFQFMKYRKLAAYISIAFFTISILSIVFRGLNLGLDFSGGMHVEVKYDAPVELESIRESLSDILKDEGYEIVVAENAVKAKEIKSNLRFDLILLDIWMPDCDGISLLILANAKIG